MHAELDRALCEVGFAREDRGDGGGSVRECLGSKDLVGLAEHACRGRVGGGAGGGGSEGTGGRRAIWWERRAEKRWRALDVDGLGGICEVSEGVDRGGAADGKRAEGVVKRKGMGPWDLPSMKCDWYCHSGKGLSLVGQSPMLECGQWSS